MIQKILVGTPASSKSDAVLNTAAELAMSYDAELVVLEVEPAIDARRVFDPAGVPELASPIAELRLAFPDLRVRSSRARGNPARTVSEAALQERADLVVVGQGRPARSADLITRRALRALMLQVACPVLLVAS